MQLILLDGLPRQDQPWEDFITASFDIDIAKGIATIGDVSAFGKLTFPPSVSQKINHGVFTHTIRNCCDLDTLVRRIQKYLKKGFLLDDLRFSDDCSQTYRLHVARRFHYHLCSTICYKWFGDACVPAGVTKDLLPTIRQFLKEPPHAKRLFRALQLETMRRKFESNGWWSVGLTDIYKCQFDDVILREHAKQCAVSRIENWFLAWKKKNKKKRNSSTITNHLPLSEAEAKRARQRVFSCVTAFRPPSMMLPPEDGTVAYFNN